MSFYLPVTAVHETGAEIDEFLDVVVLSPSEVPVDATGRPAESEGGGSMDCRCRSNAKPLR